MASDFSRHCFIFLDSPRLDFADSRAAVRAFLGRRLHYHGVGSFDIAADRGTLETIARRALAERQGQFDYFVVADVLNPLPDMELVAAMTAMIERTGALTCVCEGAIPGTEVESVICARSLDDSGLANSPATQWTTAFRPTVRWESQARHNNQLNISKYKRLKLFLKLVETGLPLHEKSVDEIMATLATDRVFQMLASFGEEVRLLWHERCPHCGHAIHALTNTMSQPFCGYLPTSRPLYHECEGCGLVVQSPYIHADDVHKIYDEWDKRDFMVSTNNPYTVNAPRCNLSKVRPHLPVGARTLDLGGGIGRFSQFLAEQNPAWKVTHSDFAIKADIEGNLSRRALDFTRQEIGEGQYDLITAWEVIEHVPFEKLDFVLSNIARALLPGGFFAFSTPDFDSPLCKSYDFFALCPPFHYTVFGERWLRSYFANSTEFEMFDVRHGSDFLDDALNWYAYGSRTCPSVALRNTSMVLREVFELDEDRAIRAELARAGIGTEIIMTMRKKVR
jgi:2-polyprenyl-3-methyl-5-hydroxy-6-metoxy-1,4-benzoquinol methylase